MRCVRASSARAHAREETTRPPETRRAERPGTHRQQTRARGAVNFHSEFRAESSENL